MKYVRISRDVWVNLEEIESITRNENGTALLQGRSRIYESMIPAESLLMETVERKEPEPVRQPIQSNLIAETRPAW